MKQKDKKQFKSLARIFTMSLAILIFACVFVFSILGTAFGSAFLFENGHHTLFMKFFIMGLVSIYISAALLYIAGNPKGIVHEEYIHKMGLTDSYMKFERKWWKGDE